MTTTVNFSGGGRIGLVVRGKKSHHHSPDWLGQHADCILSSGAPIGFYGAANAGGSSNGPSGSGAVSRKAATSSNASGLAMTGMVFDVKGLARNRAEYIDLGVAQATKTVSTVLLIQVSAREAAAFDKAWLDLTADPGSFQIVGWNCSTHASQAFKKAGVLSGGIPGLDTPNNLYKQLCFEKKGKVSTASGYVGFSASGAGYVVTIEAEAT